jgi:hypothetical protein
MEEYILKTDNIFFKYEFKVLPPQTVLHRMIHNDAKNKLWIPLSAHVLFPPSASNQQTRRERRR